MRYIVTKEIRSETKVGGPIYLKDFFFLLAGGGFVWVLSTLVHPGLRAPYYIFAAVTVLGLTMPSPFNVKRRVWQSLILCVRTDHSLYRPVKNISKQREKDKGVGKPMEETRTQKSIHSLALPAAYDQELQVYVLPDGTYMDLLKINSKDLINSDPDEIEFDCLKQAKFYKTCSEDFKLLALNFPCDLHEQIRYLHHVMERTKNQVHQEWLKTQLAELEYLQKHNTSREFYLMLFADKPQGIENARQLAVATLGIGREGLVSYLPAKKKHQILFKLCNKNSAISIE